MFGMAQGWLVEEKLTHSILRAFYDVYNELGYGFLEHLYVMALERELLSRGHMVAREVGVAVLYKGEELGFQRMDLVVDGKVIVETKSTEDLHKSATRQVYNYLKATSLEVGLLLHFGPEPRFFRLINQRKQKRNPPQSAKSAQMRHPDV